MISFAAFWLGCLGRLNYRTAKVFEGSPHDSQCVAFYGASPTAARFIFRVNVTTGGCFLTIALAQGLHETIRCDVRVQLRNVCRFLTQLSPSRRTDALSLHSMLRDKGRDLTFGCSQRKRMNAADRSQCKKSFFVLCSMCSMATSEAFLFHLIVLQHGSSTWPASRRMGEYSFLCSIHQNPSLTAKSSTRQRMRAQKIRFDLIPSSSSGGRSSSSRTACRIALLRTSVFLDCFR